MEKTLENLKTVLESGNNKFLVFELGDKMSPEKEKEFLTLISDHIRNEISDAPLLIEGSKGAGKTDSAKAVKKLKDTKE